MAILENNGPIYSFSNNGNNYYLFCWPEITGFQQAHQFVMRPFPKSGIFHSDIQTTKDFLLLWLTWSRRSFCGASEEREREAEITWRTHKQSQHNLGGEIHTHTHTESRVSVVRHTVVNRMELMSRKNTQTDFLFFFSSSESRDEEMEKPFELAGIRTAFSLISLARRDFERGTPSDKPPRINQVAGDPPSLRPHSWRLPALPCYWPTPSLSSCSSLDQSGKSNCCSHWDSPPPPSPYFCRAAAAVADCDVTAFRLDSCGDAVFSLLRKAFWEMIQFFLYNVSLRQKHPHFIYHKLFNQWIMKVLWISFLHFSTFFFFFYLKQDSGKQTQLCLVATVNKMQKKVIHETCNILLWMRLERYKSV